MVPSIDHKLWSKRPSALNRSFNRLKTRANVPSELQRLKCAYTVSHGPSSSGKSRHGAPARKIQQIPSNAFRAGMGGRPVGFAFGNKSSITAHSSSDNPCRAIVVPPCTGGTNDRQLRKFIQDRFQNKA
jgi:hypothetical protein